MSTSKEIHDLIQTAPIEVSETAISRLLDIAQAMNDRISNLEDELNRVRGTAKRAAYEASVLANGGKPD